MSKIYYGQQAVDKVTELEGTLSAAQARVVFHEGYSPDGYLDTKGIKTRGVGQTGIFYNSPYKEVFARKEQIVRSRIKNYDSLPTDLKAELMQSEYRGDLGKSPKAVKLFNAGKYIQAADEFLDNDEYRKNKPLNNSISKRMFDTYNAMRDYGLSGAEETTIPVPIEKPLTN